MINSESIGTGVSDGRNEGVELTASNDHLPATSPPREDQRADRAKEETLEQATQSAPQEPTTTNSKPQGLGPAAAAPKKTTSREKACSCDRGKYKEEEERIHKQARHNTLWLVILNGYSAMLVFIFRLISIESLISMGLSVGLTIYVYFGKEQDTLFDGSLDWVLLSFAVITPMSASIAMSFNRREAALGHLAVIRATCLNLYSSHACWDWCTKSKEGRTASSVDWLEHSDKALSEILAICHCLMRYLTLPNASRARHRITKHGREEAEDTLALASKLYGCMLVRFCQLTDLCEVLKMEGLPPNEATRIRQWERMAMERIEQIKMIKMYRTPQALRSFARLFTVFLPPFYAPSYADIARSTGSLELAIAFSILTSLALTALFETISQMEDPFVGHKSLDGIDVDFQLCSSLGWQAFTMRAHFYPNSQPFPNIKASCAGGGDDESTTLFRILTE